MHRTILIAVASLGVCVSTNCWAAQTLVYSNNFDGGVFLFPGVSGGMSGYTHTESAQGFAGLGFGANTVQGNILYNDTGDNFTNQPSQKTVLTLSGLPAHNAIDIDFLLPLMDTWDAGGDFYNVTVDGVPVFHHTFYNSSHDATYPPLGQSYINPATIVTIGNSRGFDGFWDTLYDMSDENQSFGAVPHTANTLTVEWWADGPGWNRPANEAWGMDNLNVVVTVPEPGTAGLAALGIALSGVVLLVRRWRR
jgi:PEP-CTERM motif